MQGRTWAMQGETPVVQVSTSRARLNLIGAMSLTGQLFTQFIAGNGTASVFIAFLRYVLANVSGEIVMLVDNHRMHKSCLVRGFLETQPRLSLVFLPRYAPECNPVEWLWSWVKRSLAGVGAVSVEGLRAAWKSRLARARRCDGLLVSFVAGSALKALVS